MGVIIDDGKGGGSSMGVNSDNKGLVFSTNESEFHANTDEGKAFSWSNLTYNYTAADTILLVKNTNAAEKLHVEKIYVSGDTATLVHIHLPTTNVTVTGTTVTGVNLNTSRSEIAQASAVADETNNSLGDIVLSFEMLANTLVTVELGGSIHLGENKSIGVDFVSVGASANVTIWGFYGA